MPNDAVYTSTAWGSFMVGLGLNVVVSSLVIREIREYDIKQGTLKLFGQSSQL